MPLKDAVLEGHSRTCPPSPQSMTTSERIRLRGNFQKCKSETDTNPHVAVDCCSLRWGKPTPSSYHQQQSPQDLTRQSPCKKFFLITKNIVLELQLWSWRAPALSHPHIHKPARHRGQSSASLCCPNSCRIYSATTEESPSRC